MPGNKKHGKIFNWVHSLNGKLTIVITLFTTLNFFMPTIKAALWGGDLDNIRKECMEYTDQELKNKEDRGQKILDIVLNDISKLKTYVRKDSLLSANKEWWAVGLRANKYGVLIYRDPFQSQFPVRPNFELDRYEYRDMDGEWIPCYFEKR